MKGHEEAGEGQCLGGCEAPVAMPSSAPASAPAPWSCSSMTRNTSAGSKGDISQQHHPCSSIATTLRGST